MTVKSEREFVAGLKYSFLINRLQAVGGAINQCMSGDIVDNPWQTVGLGGDCLNSRRGKKRC